MNAMPFHSDPLYSPMRVEVDVLTATGTPVEALQVPAGPPETVWHRLAPAVCWPHVVRLRFRLYNTRFYSFRIEA